MSGNRCFFLQIYRSRIQLRFHNPERFFYPPQIVVNRVYFWSRHIDFWRHHHVITGKPFGIFYCLVIHLNFDFTIGFHSFFICSHKGNVFCAVSILGFFCFACPECLCLFHLFVYFIVLFFSKFGIISYHTFFPELYGLSATVSIGVSIDEIIHTFFHSVKYFSISVFDIDIIIFQQNPGLFYLWQHLYRFRENISITSFQCVEYVVNTVEPFVSHLDGSAVYVIALLQIINDGSDYGFFAFVAGIHLHADWNLMRIEQQSHADNGFCFVLFGRAFMAKIVFAVNLKVKVGTIKVGVRSIKLICQLNLMIIDFNDLLIFRADVFKAGIELVKREVIFAKELGNDFIISSGFWTGMDASGINEGGQHVKYIEAEISCRLHQVHIFFTAESVVKIFQRKIAQEFFGRFLRYLTLFFLVFTLVVFLIKFANLFAVKSNRILDSILHEFVYIADGFVRPVCSLLFCRVIKTLINLKVNTLLEIGFF